MNQSDIYITPKETLRILKIYRSTLKKQISYLPVGEGFSLLKRKSRDLIGYLDIFIDDYEEFFKKKKEKYDYEQMKLFN